MFSEKGTNNVTDFRRISSTDSAGATDARAAVAGLLRPGLTLGWFPGSNPHLKLPQRPITRVCLPVTEPVR